MKRILYLATIMAFISALGGLTIGYSNGKVFASCGMCGSGSAAKTVAAEEEETLTDPVCGMEVKKNPDKSIKHEGYTYYFCAKACMEKFQSDTKKYACPCIDIHTGCNCYHCTGKGVACECPKEQEHKHEHEHEHKH